MGRDPVLHDLSRGAKVDPQFALSQEGDQLPRLQRMALDRSRGGDRRKRHLVADVIGENHNLSQGRRTVPDQAGRQQSFYPFLDAFARLDSRYPGFVPPILGTHASSLIASSWATSPSADPRETAFSFGELEAVLDVMSHDAPIVRQIARAAAARDHRWSSVILEIVKSTPFRMRRAES